MADEHEMTLTDLKRLLGTPEKPVKSREMMDFWTSLSESEKEEFKHADLT